MLSAPMVLTHAAQLAVLAILSGAVLALTARRLPALRLVTWRAFLAAAWLLPLLALRQPTPAPASPASTPQPAGVAILSSLDHLEVAAGATDWWPWLAASLIAGSVARLVQLGVGVVRLRQVSRQGPAASDPLFDALREGMGLSARLVWHPAAGQSFTFGSAPATVVVPAHLSSASDDIRRAIFTHELLHVRRRDWRALLVEELISAPFWFHPGIWVARRELRQAREEIVDSATVAATGRRRAYVEVLMSLAERPAPQVALSVPFFAVRQLPRRIAALRQEAPMSIARAVSAASAVAVCCMVSLVAAVQALPLPTASRFDGLTAVLQSPTSEPGPLEREAYVAPKDARPPARVSFVTPALPESLAVKGPIEMELRMILDATGRVAEARVLKVSAPGLDQSATSSITAAVVGAVRQWRYAAPTAAPLAITTSMVLEAEGAYSRPAYSTTERPIAIAIKPAVYPDDAMKTQTEGTATVQVTIDANGRVSGTKLVESTTPSMGEAAIVALKESIFHPGMRDGKAVPVTVTITVRFALK
jgi:TonB family protein